MQQQPETDVRELPNAGPHHRWRAVGDGVAGFGPTPLAAIVDLLNAERDTEQLAYDVCRTAGL